MSSTELRGSELGLRDSFDFDADFERDELPRTAARRTAAEAQARARTHSHFTSDGAQRAYAPRAARSYSQGRSRIDADGVRTIKIRGQATPPRRRPMIDASRPIARYDQHPDRAAQWALFLGVFMVVVAIVTGS